MSRYASVFVLTSLMLLSFAIPGAAQFGDPVPKYPQEMDGPVNMTNGRKLFFSATDISVPGRGFGLDFTRSYNGGGVNRDHNHPSYIGPNWSHTYQWELRTSGSRPYTTTEGGIYVDPIYYYDENNILRWIPGFWLVEPTTVQKPNTLRFHVVTGSGSTNTFTTSGSNLSSAGWEGRIKCHPQTGGACLVEAGGGRHEVGVHLHHPRRGTVYRFEQPEGITTTRHVLTKVTDRNGNSVKLHYEAAPETPAQNTRYPRLVAIEDPLGRILKLYYDLRINDVAYPRYVNKVEFGLGTAQALTTTYQTIKYTYSPTGTYKRLISAAETLGTGDPRGSEIKVQYEYNGSSSHLNAVVSRRGVSHRIYGWRRGGNRCAFQRHRSGREHPGARCCTTATTAARPRTTRPQPTARQANGMNTAIPPAAGALPKSNTSTKSPERRPSPRSKTIGATAAGTCTEPTTAMSPAIRTNGTTNCPTPGTDAAHNRTMGNVTKWEQINPASPFSAVLRKWEADYETTFNRPIWQIDSMGHKTTFSYDTKGNLTELRNKANTGSQPHSVDHDIIIKHTYNAYGKPKKTVFMEGTDQEKVVETVYDTTHHTYPTEVKTTVTVNGADHVIKTKSEWDMNRGLKTADIDAQGRRTEYAYWKDGALKYTKRAADNMYTVPTYDKNGNVTQMQVRKTNWQTGTLLTQLKTEYDAMNRAVKAHNYKDNWTTPYATTQTVFDIYGDVSQTKDPRSLIANYTVDDLGRVTKQTLPDGDWVETRYNSLGQTTKAWTSQNGSETSPAVSHSYDAKFNRLSQLSYKTGESVSYTYDLGGNTLTQTTNDGSETYTYTYTHDQLNRVVTRNDSLLGFKTFYEYDDSSMRTRMYIQPSAGGGNVYDVNYTYDEANRLIGAKDVITAKTASYDYFDIGALKTVTNPNGITAHRTLDTLNRLDTLQYKKDSTTVLSSLDYTYDDKSNVTQLVRDDTGAGGSSKTFSFGYDNLSRLTSANYGNETVSYTYDKSSNRLTQVSSVDGTTTYTIAANSNQLNRRSLVPEDSDFDTMSYTYDAEGKLTQRSEGADSDAFTYGFGSQLKQITKTRDNTVTQTLNYSYDGNGKRVKSTDSDGTTFYLYDGMMPVLELEFGQEHHRQLPLRRGWRGLPTQAGCRGALAL